MIRVEVLRPGLLPDLEGLFGADPIADACWCMWHIIRVADFHAAGREGNRASFIGLMETSAEPLGLVAFLDDEPVGWCAAGPRRRFTRALATPTLRGRDANDDDKVWLVPCFFVKSDARRKGVSRALLERAVAIAREHGAEALEGFPDAAGKSVERGLRGRESVFEACGFAEVSRPSGARVVMRRELTSRIDP